MANECRRPFESLESAHDYLNLLREALEEAYTSILDDTAVAQTAGAGRRLDALRLVEHKLNRLRQNLLASLVLLNNLRTLRRLLLGGAGGRRSGVERSSRDARAMTPSPTIVSIGYHYPERLLTNAELAQRLGKPERWILDRSGIVTRRQAASESNT